MTIYWNLPETLETILAARDKLEDQGMRRPTIRSVLYLLIGLPGWTKKHYDTLTRKLGAWRDDGVVEWGLFSPSGGGKFYRPLLPEEIHERIKALEDMVPASLMRDGYLHVVFVEHQDLVDNVSRWLDWRVPVVSSQGQIRRENLYEAVRGWLAVAEDLGAEGIKAWAVVDYDPGGRSIYETHRRWIRRQAKVDLKLWGITSDQVRAAGLPVMDVHQLDGVIAAYGPARFRRELRQLVGLES